MDKKIIWTLDIDNYQPEITALTLPYLKIYAHKIGADIFIIRDRKLTLPGGIMAGGFAGLEKFQVYELAKELKSDWNIFVDPDALIHPDFFDPTALMSKDMTAAYSVHDFTPVRFSPDPYFLRDGRFVGKGNWFGVFSDWCLDYYHPLDDISLDAAMSNCFPTVDELQCEKPMSGFNMVEDYIVSRNIARYGLKHTLVSDLIRKFGRDLNYVPQLVMTQAGQQVANSGPVFHVYTQSADQKVAMMDKQLAAWKLKPIVVAVPAEVVA